MARVTKFSVEGSRTFPVDMLRYDRCFPQSEGDSYVIERAGAFESGPHRVNLVSYAEGSVPTPKRWESFGWDVIESQRVRY